MHTRIVFGATSIAVALAAVVALPGCGSGTPTTIINCKEQYLAWRSGPAQNATKQFTVAQEGLSAAGSTKNLQMITAAVEAEGKAAANLAAYPVPACADPHGYLAALLAKVRAAATNAATAKGLPALTEAMKPLNQVPPLEGDFTIEVKQATGI